MSNHVMVNEIELREALQEAVRRNVPLSLLHQLCDLAQWPLPERVNGVWRFFWEPEVDAAQCTSPYTDDVVPGRPW